MRNKLWWLISLIVIVSLMLTACNTPPGSVGNTINNSTSDISRFPVINPENNNVDGWIEYNKTSKVLTLTCTSPVQIIQDGKLYNYCRSLPEGTAVKAMEINEAMVMGATMTADQLSRWVVGTESVVQGGTWVLSRVIVLASLPLMLSGDTPKDVSSITVLPEGWAANRWYSNAHGAEVPGWDGRLGEESQMVINAALMYAQPNKGKLQRKGDGNSNGSIRIYGGPNKQNPANFNIAGLMVVKDNIWFFVLTAPIKDAGHKCVPGSCTAIGGGKFIDPADLVWECSWVLSDGIGHESDPTKWLKVGAGWEKWSMIQTAYGPMIELMEIPLPPLDLLHLK